MKYFLGLLGGITVTLLAAYLFFTYQKTQSGVVETNTISPIETGAPLTPTPTQPQEQPGAISGKLCYPSEFLPSGAIEAKNTLTGEVFAHSYAGTEGGANNQFSVSVLPGTYVLRYKAVPNKTNPENAIYGYYTETCPTGGEVSCAQSNPRIHKQVIVSGGQTVSGVNLCDFYYNPQNPPIF